MPKLHEIPLSDVLPFRRGQATMTMSTGQWDGILAAAYDVGWVLLELDDDENPVRAYQHPAHTSDPVTAPHTAGSRSVR